MPHPAPSGDGDVVVARTADAVVVEMRGDIDAGLRNRTVAALSAIAEEPSSHIVIDASEVTFIDSFGVVFLFQVHRLGEETGRRVELRDPSAQVTNVLKLTGMADLF